MWLLGFIVAVFLNTGVHATLLGRSNFNIIKALSTFSTLTVLVKRFGTLCLSYMKIAIGRSLWVMGYCNRPFLSCSKPLFESEAECEAIDRKIISCKLNHFHKKGFALSLALKVRSFGTWKWLIQVNLPSLCTKRVEKNKLQTKLRESVPKTLARIIVSLSQQ